MTVIELVSLVTGSYLRHRSDGLLDPWEINGFTDMDGSIVDLPSMGANPNKKDLFVEIDWMTATGHSHKPKQAAIDRIAAAFATAPTPIALHIDVGQGGAFTGGNSIPETSPIAFKTDFLTIKNTNFSNARRHLLHYSPWAHAQPGTTSFGVADLVRLLGNSGTVALYQPSR